MDDENKLPENIRRAVDIISAIIRRIKAKGVDYPRNPCFYMPHGKGAAT